MQWAMDRIDASRAARCGRLMCALNMPKCKPDRPADVFSFARFHAAMCSSVEIGRGGSFGMDDGRLADSRNCVACGSV